MIDLGAMITDILLVIGVFIIAFGVWYLYRKDGTFENVDKIENELYNSIKSSFWCFVTYMFTFLILILANYGASHVVDKTPSLKIPLLLLMIFAALAANIWLVAIPVFKVGCNFIMLLASSINAYIKKEYPLNYYASKPGNRRSKRRILNDRL